MVELVEVEDESFEAKQTGPEDDDEYYTDTGMQRQSTSIESLPF
jgi:import receptor subunit TOM22